MLLNQMQAPRGANKKKVIVGRGRGSGLGKTCGRGSNGQGQRSGRGVLNSSEGGQMPMIKRMPKVGFNSRAPIIYQLVKLSDLNEFKEKTVITATLLKEKGIVENAYRPIKILGDGELKKSLIVQVTSFSKTAQESIEKAGGKAEIVKTVPVKENTKKA